MTADPSLLDRTALSADELKLASDALDADGTLERVASELGCASEEEALLRVGEALGFDFVDLSTATLDLGLLKSFPLKVIHRHSVFPLRMDEETGSLIVALGNPFDLEAADAVSAATGMSVVAVVALPRELAKLIKTHLGVGAETVDGLLAQRGERDGDVEVLEELEWDRSEASEMAQEPSVVRLVNEILGEAIEARASDIHMEAQGSGMRIRYRIDGVLQVQPTPPEINYFQAAIISRLKIMARLNIAEKRIPQDGRMKLRVAGREIDIRVSIIPMLHGEGVVMRLLDKDRMEFSLRGVGMGDHVYDRFQTLITLPHGIILVTGPTGSGKTTTLYSALSEIKNDKIKIITTEDPIEYQLEGISQIQVHTKVGLTFSVSLRSILRHDPEVILVGEIRDLETAENAVQASLTGHLVFSTLHTNDAASAFVRLMDMGMEPYLISSTLEAVMAQRLVRVVCPQCAVRYRPRPDEVPDDFPMDDECRQLREGIYRAVGCRHCRGSGYAGRIGLFELLITDEQVRHLAVRRAETQLVKQAAIESGMQTLRQDGWRKVLDGRTTIEEVTRVTKVD